MKSVLRIVLGLGLLVLVSLGALAAYLAFVFDANDYRERLSEAVAEQTGRRLTLSGELKLSVFPWLGIELGAAELGNAPGFSDRPFAALTAAEARVKLLPLLRKEIAVEPGDPQGPATEPRAPCRWQDQLGRPDRAAPGG
ncbi:AsmA family protein [Denitromonas sp.]|uniref:AsmA family protein n=1 Tax=Denitromonas sp. TaxID=2734609 RepID=UPI002AFE3C13|nr:AsmA family protein [Denitromonas sp.]